VIRIDSMTQAKAICEKCRSQKHRVAMESDRGPQPCTDVEREQDRVDGNDSAAEVIGSIVEKGGEFGSLRRSHFREPFMAISDSGGNSFVGMICIKGCTKTSRAPF